MYCCLIICYTLSPRFLCARAIFTYFGFWISSSRKDFHFSSSPFLTMSGMLRFGLPSHIDHLEEQEMEVEAMQAVFMDDFECTYFVYGIYDSSFK